MAKSDKKRGLGRGLSALMADVSEQTSGQPAEDRSRSTTVLPIEQISPNPDQPRKHFSEEELAELAASISQRGVIQPLVVREVAADSYQIVAGERRWRASQVAKLHEVPVVIRDYTDTEVLEVAIIENIQRSDLNPVEEAAGYKQLMDSFGHTQEQMAQSLGKSRSYIANVLRLLNLPVKVQGLLAAGDISIGHARALVPSPDAESLADQIVSKGLSVRETEALVKAGPARNAPSSKSSSSRPEKDADTKALEGDLSAALGMKVTIDHSGGSDGGELKIRYKSLENLDNLCQKLGGY